MTNQGHVIGSTRSPASGKVHVVDSVIAQLVSGEDLGSGLCEDNIRYQKVAGQGKRTFLFVVDTSGSMLSAKRLSMVKGCVVSLLKDAYVKRNRVGIVGFGGHEARVVLPFTTSPELAAARIDAMTGGGGTPFIEALELALPLIQAEQGSQLELVLLSDGRYNRPRGIVSEKFIRDFGAFCKKCQVDIHYIDVCSGNRTALKRSLRLASMLHADYRRLESMRAEALVEVLQ